LLVTNKRRGNAFAEDKVVIMLENDATKEYARLKDKFTRICYLLKTVHTGKPVGVAVTLTTYVL
jgi:hypothetical protein